MEAKASAKYVRVSPRKARRVIDLIRGQHVDEARRILRLSAYGVNSTVAKVLESAVANAGQVPGTVPENLFVTSAYVDEGPTLRRFRPRAMGRATRIDRRTSHITLVVGTTQEVAGGPES
ncbi:MAG TPA: 50S ribosomal protein L22 [Actinomycetota bacterium]